MIHKTAEAVQRAYAEATGDDYLNQRSATHIASATLHALVTWMIEAPEVGGVPYPDGMNAAEFEESGYVKGFNWLVDATADLADMLAVDADIPNAERLVGALPRETVQTLRNVVETAIRTGMFPNGSENLAHASNAVEAADKALGRAR